VIGPRCGCRSRFRPLCRACTSYWGHAGYRAAWGASPAQVQVVRRVAAYETADPEVIIAEHVVVGTLTTKATTFTVPGLLILHVRNGLITRVRDYMDGSGVASARA
jgi:uncharacterized protein